MASMAARQARTKCNRRPSSFTPVDPSFAGLTQFPRRLTLANFTSISRPARPERGAKAPASSSGLAA